MACVSSHQNRQKQVADNLTLRQKTVQVYDNNPFIVRGGSGEEVPVTKVWISDIPISVDGKDIETALVRLGCVLRSSLINEKIRNKDRTLTNIDKIPDWPAVCVRQHLWKGQ